MNAEFVTTTDLDRRILEMTSTPRTAREITEHLAGMGCAVNHRRVQKHLQSLVLFEQLSPIMVGDSIKYRRV